MQLDLLPEELLAEIFNQSDNKTILNLLLVCRRFFNIIVDRLKLQDRFQLTLRCCDSGSYDYGVCALPANCFQHQEKCRGHLKKLGRIFTSVHLKCWNFHGSTVQYQALYLFLQKHGKNVEDLKISHFNAKFNIVASMLQQVPNVKSIELNEFTINCQHFNRIKRMVRHNFPKLKILIVNTQEISFGEEKFLTRMFENVDHLTDITLLGHNISLKFLSTLIFNQLNLQSLNVKNLATLLDYEKCGQSINFQLTSLIIHMQNTFNIADLTPLEIFIQSQKEIKQLTYNCQGMDFRIFESDIIVNHLTSLQSICRIEVIGNGQNYLPHGVQYLSIDFFTNLRKLIIRRFHGDILLNLEMPKLEELEIYDIEILGAIDSFLRKNQSVETLKVSLAEKQHKEILEVICRCKNNLKTLILDKRHYSSETVEKTVNIMRQKCPRIKVEVL